MSDLHLIAIVTVVASALRTPWWYPPLCAAVLVAWGVLTRPWWASSSYQNLDLFLLVFPFGITIAVCWLVGWFIRQGLLIWTRHR